MASINIIGPIKNTSVYKGTAKACQSVRQGFFDIIPEATLKGEKSKKVVEKIGREISSAENRLILGATALMSQPFIDARNKQVDEKTRNISVARTIAKIIAGTITGYCIRKGTISAVKSMSKLSCSLDKNGKRLVLNKWNTLFSPKDLKCDTTDAYLQYQNALGTIVALVGMMFTNFLIDAPLTKYLTNVFAKLNGGDKNASKR